MTQIVQCPNCGKQYTATNEQLGDNVDCTQCGQRFAAEAPVPAAPPPDQFTTPGPTVAPIGYATPTTGTGKATAAMVLGIISIPTCFAYGIPSMACGILAVAFGQGVKKSIRRGQTPPSALANARAGVICGVIGIVLSVVAWILLAVYVAFVVSMISSMSAGPSPSHYP